VAPAQEDFRARRLRIGSRAHPADEHPASGAVAPSRCRLACAHGASKTGGRERELGASVLLRPRASTSARLHSTGLLPSYAPCSGSPTSGSSRLATPRSCYAGASRQVARRGRVKPLAEKGYTRHLPRSSARLMVCPCLAVDRLEQDDSGPRLGAVLY
jgi:hypothetical protein